MSNAILEHIRQVLGNLVRNFKIQQTYVDKNDPWRGILAAAAFAILSTTRRQQGYSPGQLIFGRDTILPIKYTVDWELIFQRKQIQMNIDNACNNKHIVDYEYKVRDKFMILNHTAYKYETAYKGPFVIIQYFTNDTIMLQCGTIKITHNIRRIKPYQSDTKVEYFNPKNMYDAVNIQRTSHILLYEIKACNKVYVWIHTATFDVHSYRPCK